MDLLPFQPNIWTRNRHVQTILGELLDPQTPQVKSQKSIFTLSDGDRLSFRTYRGTSKYVFVVGHGLTGSNRSKYVKSICYELNKRGHSVIAFNHRNCGEGFGLARKTYHSGRSEDIGELITFVRSRYPKHKCVAIGYSMSGNALLRLMGSSADNLPDAAIAINAPINIGKTSLALGRGVNRLYEVNFIRNLKRYTSRLYRRGLLAADYKFSDFFTSMTKFDQMFTGPESGYGTAENYYQSCSAMHSLSNIDRPTFILMAKDDPFVDHEDFSVARQNPHIHLQIEKYGGHMGYLSHKVLPHGNRRWMDYAILQMVQKIIS